jgi:hypothetical protein
MYDGLVRDARRAPPLREGVIGHVSLESVASNVTTSGIPRLPEPEQYRAIIHAIQRDMQRAETLQRLYFPSIQRYYEVHEDRLIPFIVWLENHMLGQEEDFAHWAGQFPAVAEQEWYPLHDAYGRAHWDLTKEVVSVVLPDYKPSRAWSLFRLRR